MSSAVPINLSFAQVAARIGDFQRNLKIAEIGREFIVNIRRDIGDRWPELLASLNRQKELDEWGNGCCPTHDFMDANMPMEEAFEKVMGRDIALQDDGDLSLWNAAWDWARNRMFFLGQPLPPLPPSPPKPLTAPSRGLIFHSSFYENIDDDPDSP